MWIPAHRGHFGNSLADDLAKKGASSTNGALKRWVNRPSASVLAQVRDYVYRQWTEGWHNLQMARATKQFYFSPNPQKARYVYKLARLELGRFVRLITGHNLNFFQAKIGLWGSAVCRFCETGNETFWHLLTEYPRFRQTRTELFLDTSIGNDMTWSVRDLLDFSYTPAIDAAFVRTWAHGDADTNHLMDSLGSETDETDSSEAQF